MRAEALRGLDRESEVVRTDLRLRKSFRPEAGLESGRLPLEGLRGGGEVVGSVPRGSAPAGAREEQCEAGRLERTARLSGPTHREQRRRRVVVGRPTVQGQAHEDPVAPVHRSAVAFVCARAGAASEPALDGHRVDEPLGQLARNLQVPQRGQERCASQEAETESLRGTAGAMEVMQEPLHFGRDVPGPLQRFSGRERCEPAQRQAAVFEERLAQVPVRRSR